MKIQIIGLPGSGKSYLIKEYLEERNLEPISYIDMASEEFNTKKKVLSKKGNFYIKDIKLFEKRIRGTKGNVLAESACGVFLRESEVIKLVVDSKKRQEQFESRENIDVDIHYESLLETRMIPATYTVINKEALFDVLDTLLRK